MRRGSPKRNPLGYLSLVLHAHLPYVRHPEHSRCLEETWFFEAITETYIPLLTLFERLAADGIPFRLTLSLSPTLVSMLQDSLLQQRYREHMARLTCLAEREVDRTRDDRRLQPLARMYLSLFSESVAVFDAYQGNLVNGFRRFQRSGCLELITCAATHGYLPLLRDSPGAVRAQLTTAARFHEETFNNPAPGVWLPECGYYPGLEDRLRDVAFGYFVVDTHGILNAATHPRFGVYAPLSCDNGVIAFGRDPASASQVWSAVEGYPGDNDYREFYRDIGFDLAPGDLEPWLDEGQLRVATGIKYWRITGRGGEPKQPYVRARALARADRHAGHFLLERQRQAARLRPGMDRPPLILAPYDAELFGHWWFEGPQWLEGLLRRIHDQKQIELITPTEYVPRHPVLQRTTPSASSWGEQGYNGYWLNEETAWIYPHLHQAARRLQALASSVRDRPAGDLSHRALSQAARSLLLAQSSDWAFMMKARTTADYARRRTREQLGRFQYLIQSVENGSIDERRLRGLEAMDNVFPDLDYRVFLEAGRSSYPE